VGRQGVRRGEAVCCCTHQTHHKERLWREGGGKEVLPSSPPPHSHHHRRHDHHHHHRHHHQKGFTMGMTSDHHHHHDTRWAHLPPCWCWPGRAPGQTGQHSPRRCLRWGPPPRTHPHSAWEERGGGGARVRGGEMRGQQDTGLRQRHKSAGTQSNVNGARWKERGIRGHLSC
jgi:hypothetical protein